MFNNTFLTDIQSLVEISSIEAEQMILNGDELSIFIGRSSCPYCQKFVKKLAIVSQEIDKKIYFINSEAMTKELMAFRDKYNIVTVPGFIYANMNKVRVKCDSGMSLEEIKEMI